MSMYQLNKIYNLKEKQKICTEDLARFKISGSQAQQKTCHSYICYLNFFHISFLLVHSTE